MLFFDSYHAKRIDEALEVTLTLFTQCACDMLYVLILSSTDHERITTIAFTTW